MNKQEEVNKKIEEVATYLQVIYGIPSDKYYEVVDMLKHLVEYCNKTMIKKASEWLTENADYYVWFNPVLGESGMTDDFLDEFKKANKYE